MTLNFAVEPVDTFLMELDETIGFLRHGTSERYSELGYNSEKFAYMAAYKKLSYYSDIKWSLNAKTVKWHSDHFGL